MPELPEVETVRRTLAERVVGKRVERVRVHRRDVVRGGARDAAALLRGTRLVDITRHGKQLAIVGASDSGQTGCVCVHLGMSGSLCVAEQGTRGLSRPTGTEVPEPQNKADHVHVVWTLDDRTRLRFRDPRRFGGLWVFPSEQELHQRRWDRLGPDALSITPGRLHAGLCRTRRALKAALLDQHLVAGLGNIYVDELLHATGLHPRKMAAAVTHPECVRLVRVMRRLLNRAIDAGGSTLRDYVDASGNAGGYQARFRAYGRGGQPCKGCGEPLGTLVVAGRTTTACDTCQGGAVLTGE